MLIRVYSLKVNISGNKVVQKIVSKFFWQKVFLAIWMCSFRIWSLEAAIMQASQAVIKLQKVIV